MKKALYSLIFLLALVFRLQAQTIEVSGSVSGTWDVDTVKVTGDIIVEEGNTLQIEQGVMVEFQQSYSFYVGGTVLAQGGYSHHIRFDIHDTTDFSIDSVNRGGWNGIQFYYTSDFVSPSEFSYCEFRHGKAVSADSLECYGGSFNIRGFAQVHFFGCLFEDNFARYNGGAIYLAEESDIDIQQCTFRDNRCGPVDFPYGYGGAICSDGSDPYIFWNNFEGNASTGVGGAVAVRFHDARVHNNTFTGNYSALGGAIGYLHYYEFPHSQCNNLFYGNTAEFFGGAIANLDAGPTFVNNTIADNSSTYGGGVYSKDSIIPSYYNCILWGNIAAVGPQVYLWDAYASANFFYCDVQGGITEFGGSGGGGGYLGIYENNIEIDPVFEYSFGPYSLGWNSPCIDAGTPDTTGLDLPYFDITGFERIWCFFNCFIDMGCYEMWWEGTREGRHPGEYSAIVFPNPVEGTSVIGFDLKAAGDYTICILDLCGRNIGSIFTGRLETGKHEMDLHTDFLPVGTYLVRIEGRDNQSQSIRIIRSSK